MRITHEWRESTAVTPLGEIESPTYPKPGAEVNDSIVTFAWPKVDEAGRYHLQVSRRTDFAYPYRTSLDVIIPTTSWTVPYTGIFSPDTTYHWRLRCQDNWGVWGEWSDRWTFTWHGPRVPVDLKLDREGQAFTLRWKPNPRGARPVRYEVYGSDERGFSIRKDEHVVPGRGDVPANLLGATEGTSMLVCSPTLDDFAANRVYYRVVAIDAAGTQSGCSDYVELPHPHVYSSPVDRAQVGRPYEYPARSLHSLGDYQCKLDPDSKTKAYAYKFWDVEKHAFQLKTGPSWLAVDDECGLLSGTPGADDAGTTDVTIEVTNQFGGRAEQRFSLTVTK